MTTSSSGRRVNPPVVVIDLDDHAVLGPQKVESDTF